MSQPENAKSRWTGVDGDSCEVGWTASDRTVIGDGLYRCESFFPSQTMDESMETWRERERERDTDRSSNKDD